MLRSGNNQLNTTAPVNGREITDFIIHNVILMQYKCNGNNKRERRIISDLVRMSERNERMERNLSLFAQEIGMALWSRWTDRIVL